MSEMALLPHERSDRCPPHNFHVAASWEGEQSKGYIYCRACGEIRELMAPTLSAPAAETVGATTRYWDDPEPKG